LPFSAQKFQGVEAELRDCAFPLLDDIVCCTDKTSGWKDTDYAFMIGAKPREPGPDLITTEHLLSLLLRPTQK